MVTTSLSKCEKLRNAMLKLHGRPRMISRFDYDMIDKLVMLNPGQWSDYQFGLAYQLAGKYRTTLHLDRILFSELPRPEAKLSGGRVIKYDPELHRFVMLFGPDIQLIEEVRAIPGSLYKKNYYGQKAWLIPPSALALRSMSSIATQYRFQFADNSNQRMVEIISRVARNVDASRAEHAEIEVKGLNGELRPFQKAGIAYATRVKRLIIGDEMGLGKTVQSIATAHHLGAYPCLVVCPATLKPNWVAELRKWLPDSRILMLEGRKDICEELGDGLFGDAPDFVVANYDILTGEDVAVPLKTDPTRTKLEWRLTGNAAIIKGIGLQSIIIDEFHNCKSPKANRTKVCKLLAKGLPVAIGLTGTPIENRAEELISQLDIIGRLGEFGNKHGFMKRYVWIDDCQRSRAYEELNIRLRETCYVRRRKGDVLKELPPKQFVNVPLDIDNMTEYRQAFRDVAAWCKEHRGTTISETNEQLIRIGVLKQVAAQGMLKAGFQWLDEFLASGEKIVVFAWHTAIVQALAQRYKCKSIHGATSIEDRQYAVEQFQNGHDQMIVLNTKSGGVGLTLTASSNVAFFEYPWTPTALDQAADRCHRIGQKDQVTVWQLVARNTIYEWIIELLGEKREVCKAITDGTVGEENGTASILNDLVKRLANHK